MDIQKERAALLADMDAMRARVERFCGEPKPEGKPWPQVGDEYLCVEGSGAISALEWSGRTLSKGRLAIGNVYRPERRAYAERHTEATKVQAELRRMAGACSPLGALRFWCIAYSNQAKGFCALCHYVGANDYLPLGGVAFESQKQAENAIHTITQERLATLRDDYLQKEITL